MRPWDDSSVEDGQAPEAKAADNGTTKPGRKRRSLPELLEAAATRPVLDPEEVGAVLRIGASTAYRLIAAGKIPSIQIPGTNLRRVRRDTLQRLIVRWEGDGRRRLVRRGEGKES
jgi:excisionase family DNA binding protein